VHDLNADPRVPLPDADVDAAVCCVSIDYLTRPIEVLADVGRVLRPGGALAITYSNRCFPTKAVRGWLATDDAQHGLVVAELVRRTGAVRRAPVALRTPPGRGDRCTRSPPPGCPPARRRRHPAAPAVPT
jgi:SAM-dependent methyltransferase